MFTFLCMWILTSRISTTDVAATLHLILLIVIVSCYRYHLFLCRNIQPLSDHCRLFSFPSLFLSDRKELISQSWEHACVVTFIILIFAYYFHVGDIYFLLKIKSKCFFGHLKLHFLMIKMSFKHFACTKLALQCLVKFKFSSDF